MLAAGPQDLRVCESARASQALRLRSRSGTGAHTQARTRIARASRTACVHSGPNAQGILRARSLPVAPHPHRCARIVICVSVSASTRAR